VIQNVMAIVAWMYCQFEAIGVSHTDSEVNATEHTTATSANRYWHSSATFALPVSRGPQTPRP